MKRFSSKLFSYCSADQTIATEASNLGREYPFGRVYPDACDECFTIVNERTGAEVVFYVSSVEMNFDDIRFWRLTPTPESLRKSPALHGVRVIVFND